MIGTFRSAGSAERLQALGAEPVALDLLDARAVRKAVLASEPEAIVHQATALREWLPVLADALGAKPPRRVPRWLARLFAGEAAVMMATESRGASNAKAKRELGWEPRYPSWRMGFVAAYATATASDGRQPHPTARARHSQT